MNSIFFLFFHWCIHDTPPVVICTKFKTSHGVSQNLSSSSLLISTSGDYTLNKPTSWYNYCTLLKTRCHILQYVTPQSWLGCHRISAAASYSFQHCATTTKGTRIWPCSFPLVPQFPQSLNGNYWKITWLKILLWFISDVPDRKINWNVEMLLATWTERKATIVRHLSPRQKKSGNTCKRVSPQKVQLFKSSRGHNGRLF